MEVGASCRTRTVSLSVLLQSATVPPQELASIRTELLRQYISWQDFQPFVQRTFTVSPVNSGFQRPLRKSRTILPIAVQNLLTLLPVSFYWSFYWRSFWFTSRPPL